MSRDLQLRPLQVEGNWENVPTIVHKTFLTVQGNMNALKKWAEKQEDRVKRVREDAKESEKALGAAGEVLQKTAEQVKELTGDLEVLREGQKREAEVLSDCLDQLLATMGGLVNHLGKAFGDTGGAAATGQDSLVPGDPDQTERDSWPANSLPQAAPLEQARSGALQKKAGDPDDTGQVEARLSVPAVVGFQKQEGESPGGESSDSERGPPAAIEEARERQATPDSQDDEGGFSSASEELHKHSSTTKSVQRLVEFQSDTAGLQRRLEHFRVTLEHWTLARSDEQIERGIMHQTISELRQVADRTRERLLAWREVLKESSEAVDGLGQSLSGTQSAVRDLQIAQVRRCDVEEAVERRAKELEALRGSTEQRVDSLTEHVDSQVQEVERRVRENQKRSEDLFKEHGLHAQQLLEQSLNPVSAYLNTMHVKADVVRVELDSIGTQLPKLATKIEELVGAMRSGDEAGENRTELIENRLDDLKFVVDELGGRHSAKHTELHDSIKDVEGILESQHTALREHLDGTAGDLRSLRTNDVSGLQKSMTTLEQQFAKWVHANPLPAKVSEARLYSLEARLGQEAEARLRLEYALGIQSLTPVPEPPPSAAPKVLVKDVETLVDAVVALPVLPPVSASPRDYAAAAVTRASSYPSKSISSKPPQSARKTHR